MTLNQDNRRSATRHQPPHTVSTYMRSQLLPVLVVCGLLGCQQTQQPKTSSSRIDTGNVAVKKDAAPNPVTQNEVVTGDTVRLTLGKGAAPMTSTVRSDSLHPTVVCALQVAEAGILSAEIVPSEKGANIRFSQLYMPDGTTDGPFGRTLTYTLKQAGLVRLRMSPSQMASGPYAGTFTIRLQLK